MSAFKQTILALLAFQVLVPAHANVFKHAVSGLRVISAAAPPATQLAVLSASTAEVNFGLVETGHASTQSMTLTNTGGRALTLLSLPTLEGSGFRVTSTCTSTLVAGATCPVNITFEPTTAGPQTTSLVISSDASNASVAVSLTGDALLGVQPYSSAGVTAMRWTNGTQAQTCKGYRTATAPYAAQLEDGLYWVQPTGQSMTAVYCDMTTDGGGWTLVLKGVSKQLAGWNTAAALNPAALQSPAFAGLSGKLSDAFINATKTVAYRLQGSSYFPGIPTRYVPASCVYAHTTSAAGTCATTYPDLAMSTGAATQTAARGGISDYRSSGEYITFITNADGNWFVGTNQSSKYEGGTGHTPSNGLQAGSSIRMWVR